MDIPTGKSKGMPETTRPRKLKPLSSSPPSSSSTSLDSPPLSPSKKAQTLMSRMSRRPLLKPLLFTLLLFSILYFLFPLSRSLSSPVPSIVNPPSNAPPPPKIYLYDLPHKFTHGVIESYALARSTATVKYPGHQHSAEWFLFSDLTNPNRPPNSPLALTSDPDVADLFFVPFFSSLSLVVNPIRPAAGDNGNQIVYSDEARQEELVEWLEKQEHWIRNKGRDHVFICQDPNALYRVIGRIKNGVLLVSDFGRLRGDQASLVKDVILPYSHRINSYNGEVGVEKRTNLLFFMGNRYRKEGGKVRDTLFQILENQKDVVIKHGAQSRESRRMASQGMHSSKFCLHPAGDTPSACRLFDAIVSLCIPVIVSDYIELPFEDAIDYGKIAIFVDTNNAVKPGYLISMLRDISTERILQYQQELKLVKRYFEYEDPNGTVNEIWRQVSSKLPLIKLMINRDKRLIDRGLDDPDCSCLCTKQNETIAIR